MGAGVFCLKTLKNLKTNILPSSHGYNREHRVDFYLRNSRFVKKAYTICYRSS